MIHHMQAHTDCSQQSYGSLQGNTPAMGLFLYIDGISNLSEQVHTIETRLVQESNRELLIREAFIVWYMLSEGACSEQFSEKELLQLLRRNFERYQQAYSDDVDYTFLTGWMMHTAFWFFRSSYDESYGVQLMQRAWRMAPGNSLFKWAVRQELMLEKGEIHGLQQDIRSQFNQYYDYGPVIKKYFLELV